MEILSTRHIFEEVVQAPEKDVVEIGESDKTPKIYLNQHTGMIKFAGRAIPENAKTFFEPLIQWIQQYVESPRDKTLLHFDFEYFNSSSSKLLMEILNLSKQILEKGKELIVEWNYLEEDEEMLDAGETFEELTGLNFNYVAYD